MNYTRLALTAHIKSLGLPISDFMLVGVRSKEDKPDVYDDKFYIITQGSMFTFDCTTNAGAYYLMNLLNPKGAAVLRADRCYKYKLGTHKGYEALVQAGPVEVYRDKNRDRKIDINGPTEWGWFGINIHRGSEGSVGKFIGKFSAGCQVIANPSEFKLLLDECKKTGQHIFNYILLNEF